MRSINYKTHIRFNFRYLLLIYLFVITLFVVGCKSSSSSWIAETETLNAIYENSNWEFRQSSVNIKVYDQGAIQISVQGEAQKKEPLGDEIAWIPIVVLKNKPQYYEIQEDKSNRISLTTYEGKKGSWNLIAFVPDEKNIFEQEDNEQNIAQHVRNINIDLHFLIISEDLKDSLDLFLPIGKYTLPVKLSIQLAKEGVFTSSQIIPVKNNGKSQPLRMGLSPASLLQYTTALSTLDSDLSTLWSLSQVKYKTNLLLKYILGLVTSILIWYAISSFINRVEDKQYKRMSLIKLRRERRRERNLERKRDIERERERERNQELELELERERERERYQELELELELELERERYQELGRYQDRNLVLEQNLELELEELELEPYRERNQERYLQQYLELELELELELKQYLEPYQERDQERYLERCKKRLQNIKQDRLDLREDVKLIPMSRFRIVTFTAPSLIFLVIYFFLVIY